MLTPILAEIRHNLRSKHANELTSGEAALLAELDGLDAAKGIDQVINQAFADIKINQVTVDVTDRCRCCGQRI